jgi:hypothetical protein
MFREMRRKRQQMSDEEARELLKNGKYLVLAVSGDDGYPYSVPLSYFYEDNAVYFHCARSGHKLDAIKANPKVSFCVVGDSQIVENKVTVFFSSVIAFGKAEILEGGEKFAACRKLGDVLCPHRPDKVQEDMDNNFSKVEMVKINIEHLTGKKAIELL